MMHNTELLVRFKTLNLLRLASVFVVLFCFSACTPNSEKTKVDTPKNSVDSLPSLQISADSLDAVVNSIIAISTNDFYKNQQPIPVAFRDVQLKYYFKPNKELLYILCGEFSAQAESEKTEWTHFTTIKNIDYEQWIGPNGLTYCEHSTAIDYTKADLASLLKQHLDELKTKH